MRDVWKAATGKKGRLLIVEKDYIFAAQNGGTKNVIYMAATPTINFQTLKTPWMMSLKKFLKPG
jgi:hypothetical protein